MLLVAFLLQVFHRLRTVAGVERPAEGGDLIKPFRPKFTDKNWDRCYDFKNIFAKKIGIFYKKKQSLIMQKFDHNIGF
jgi:hypothetical protein